jgi:hypothetical protein
MFQIRLNVSGKTGLAKQNKGTCEFGNELSGSIKYGEFVD